MRVFVHGAGRVGRDAWPAVPQGDAVFLDLSAASVAEKIEAVVETVQPSDTVVAHSLGAVPVALALRQGLIAPRRVVLLEPALYDIARGDASIEKHIAVMTAARSRAERGDLFGYWSLVRPVMFGGPAEVTEWAEEQDLATRFASIESPWGYALDGSEVVAAPTFVVTGGWNPEYEAIAHVLATHGAHHVHLKGCRHRPQDHPDFLTRLSEWESD